MTLNLGNMGDFMPHENKVYLPVCDSKKVYYERMINEIFRDKEKIAYKYFLQLWKKHFANYIVGKPSTFSQCTDCVVLDEHQRKLGTEKERKEAAAMLVMHKKQAEIERRHYHTRRIAAQQNPEEWIAVIIDGMDQSKTDVPHLVKESKSTAGLLRLKTHITGVLVHTDCKEGKEAHVYIDLTEYPHDANLTMNILLDIIVRYRNKPARKIHVQLDNCFRENKNRFVLSLGWLIVELGIFDEVHFSFLPVGHTHEDVDQLFSRISTKIKHTDVYTLDALKDTIHKSYTPNVNVTRLVEVLDIKEWLTPVMENQWGNHSKPHHFLFKRVDGITQMFYRKWVTDSWRPNEEGHDMELIGGDKEVMSQEFKNGIQCMKAVPDMALKPKTVRPFPRKWGFEELEKTIPTSYGERIPEMYRQWWVDFHRSTRLYLEPKQVVETDDITWSLLQLLDRPRKPPELVVENEHLQKIRKRLMEDCPEVFVGKRPTKKKKKQQDIEQKDGEEGADERDDDKVELVENKTYSFDGFVEIGDIVILNLEKYPDEFPLMGQVIEKCDDDEMLIRFYAATGSLKMGQKWSPAFMEEGHRRVPYTEKVTKGSVMLKGFELVEEKVTVNEQMMKALDLLKDMLEKGV